MKPILAALVVILLICSGC